MADLYLESIGLINPTIVERDNNGKIERLESRGLDMASLVAFWRRCFDLNGLLFEKITLHCKLKYFNAMGGRTLATCRSVRELLAEQGVECVVDDEWFKGKEDHCYELKDKTEQLKQNITKNKSKRYPVAIDDLLIEFDDMDYCPMNLSGGDPVKEAITWKDRLRYELDLLLDEKSAIERRVVEELAEKLKAVISNEMVVVRDCTGEESALRRRVDVDILLKKIEELLKEFENDN